ncbi:hypothetical protein chiPu_0025556 [Chiloscyllium punctatum]|uniref:Uncharacterized protein n=1 Tax=Chiloscyllium punctatum TaxID=137246 RepID=A0A401TH81_CHIPU|nr:hypothetical protein [Chiloscyllium punctatum]
MEPNYSSQKPLSPIAYGVRRLPCRSGSRFRTGINPCGASLRKEPPDSAAAAIFIVREAERAVQVKRARPEAPGGLAESGGPRWVTVWLGPR